MDDLWDTDEPKEVTQFSGNQLAKISPNEIVEYDAKNEKLLVIETDQLKKSLAFCEQVVTAAYNVTKYVPDLGKDSNAEFWRKKVIPNLVESLTQDIRGRNLLVRSFGAVRDLSLIIQSAAEIIHQTRGSAKGIEIAQKNIPGALKILDNCIEEASNMSNTAIETFASQSKKLFEIIGPDAAHFIKQKVECENELNRMFDQQEKLYSRLGEKQGEATRLLHMIRATEKQLLGTNEALEENKRRETELNNLNIQVEKSINAIPKTEPKTVTTTTHRRGGWWWWRRHSTETTSQTVQVRNPYLETDTAYYDGVIKARMARQRENKTDEESKLRVKADLDVSLSALKDQYDKAKEALNDQQKKFGTEMAKIQTEIEKQYERIKQINDTEANAIETVGYGGDILIRCLVSLHAYSKSLKDGAQAHEPLVAILKGLRAMVSNDVELLCSNEREDIFIAGFRLFHQVKMLTNFSLQSRPCLQTSPEYKAICEQ